jgi:hypothetical protein
MARSSYVATLWPPDIVRRLDKAREGTYLTRSKYVLKIVEEHLATLERKGKEGLGAHRLPTQAPKPRLEGASKFDCQC